MVVLVLPIYFGIRSKGRRSQLALRRMVSEIVLVVRNLQAPAKSMLAGYDLVI